MNIQPIDPTSVTLNTQAGAPAKSPATKASKPASAGAAAPAVRISPAVTVAVTGVPASVSAEDRALYLQILKSVGGNAAVALAVLQARKASAAAG
jgi:hypothetical protein